MFLKEEQHALELELKGKGADIIWFADLSSLSEKITRGVLQYQKNIGDLGSELNL